MTRAYLAPFEPRSDSQHLATLQFETWNLSLPPSPKPILYGIGTVKIPNAQAVGNVCLDDSFKHGLIGNQLLKLDYKVHDITAKVIRELKFQTSSPPIKWLVATSDGIFLGGAHNQCLEDFQQLCDEEDDRKHEQHVTGVIYAHCPPASLKDADSASIICCDLCAHTSAESVSCQICGSERGGLDLCPLCVRKGGWCEDRSHQLRARAQGDTVLSWRPSHFFAKVSLHESGQEPSILLHERLSTMVYNEPNLLRGLTKLFWLLDEAHVLVYNYETGEQQISAIGRENMSCK